MKNAGKASPEGEGNWAKSCFEDLVQYNDGFKSNLIGTPEQIAERIVALKDVGADLVLLGFLHFHEEVEFFGKRSSRSCASWRRGAATRGDAVGSPSPRETEMHSERSTAAALDTWAAPAGPVDCSCGPRRRRDPRRRMATTCRGRKRRTSFGGVRALAASVWPWQGRHPCDHRSQWRRQDSLLNVIGGIYKPDRGRS